MKTSIKVLLITAAVLVGVGIIGAVVYYAGGTANRYTAYEYCDDDDFRQSGMYNRYSIDADADEDDTVQDGSDTIADTWQDSGNYSQENWSGSYYCDTDEYYGSRGMMGGYFYQSTDEGELLDLETLTDNVNEYISGFDEELEISDIFVFEDSDYYFSIIEEDTGLGAFELLVNPYTGNIYPEMGPNMMWNTKYGMHASSEYGMINGRGMMGRYSYQDAYSAENGSAERNTISYSEALEIAGSYLQNGYTVSDEGHEFYGYYTFHTLLNGEEAGMMSVNGFTGAVWYHTWHGKLAEVIGGHVH